MGKYIPAISASTHLAAFSSRIQRRPYTLRSPLNNNWASSLFLSHTAAFPGESLPSQNQIFRTTYFPNSNDFHHNTQDAYLLLACGTSSPGLTSRVAAQQVQPARWATMMSTAAVPPARPALATAAQNTSILLQPPLVALPPRPRPLHQLAVLSLSSSAKV